MEIAGWPVTLNSCVSRASGYESAELFRRSAILAPIAGAGIGRVGSESVVLGQRRVHCRLSSSRPAAPARVFGQHISTHLQPQMHGGV
jgi:hypothetical protein